MTLLASLAFLTAATIATLSMLGTVMRYRGTVLANIAAARDIAETRDFEFRVFDFARQPANIGKTRRSSQRIAPRRAITPAGLRAAA